MSRWRKFPPGVFDILLDDEQRPPCAPPDGCAVCRLFGQQRPDESRLDWLARITGSGRGEAP